DLMMGGSTGPRTIAMAAAAVLTTPILMWGAMKYLAADWARQIASLSETPVEAKSVERHARPSRFAIDRLLRPWLRDPIERGAFRFATAYLTRDRDIRMRIYP